MGNTTNEKWPFKLFSGFGIEVEYMVVNKDTYEIMTIVEGLFDEIADDGLAERNCGKISWSNELAAHVVELKGSTILEVEPNYSDWFHQNVLEINTKLASKNAVLMPGGAHLTMDTSTESVLWPHGQKEIYEKFDEIFNCKGHGWTNLQSVHINLPFSNEKEFVPLHCAIRLLLPLIPCLTASSPILDGMPTGWLDTRLFYYANNCKKIPAITGLVIPEHVESIEEYNQEILGKIYKELKPYDDTGILMDEWVNARGAIARFDRGAIEIRIIDTQEAPIVDESIVMLVTKTLESMIKNYDVVQISKEADLKTMHDLFVECAKNGFEEKTRTSYYEKFMNTKDVSVKGFWDYWSNKVFKEQKFQKNKACIDFILQNGSLSSRMLDKYNNGVSILDICKSLSDSLAKNEMFQ